MIIFSNINIQHTYIYRVERPWVEKSSPREVITYRKIQLTFAVKQRNVAKLESTLLSVSSPKSPNYGKLLTLEQVNELTLPADAHLDAVLDFLRANGVAEWEISSGFIRTTVPISVAEKMLGTEYKQFTHKATGETVLRCVEYSLPENVAAAVDFVSPTVNFPANFKPTAIQSDVAAAYQNTPDSLRALYSVGATQGHNSTKYRQAVTAFLGQYYRETDLQNFYKTYYPILSGVPIYNVVGPNTIPGGIEAALDVDYMTTLGSGVLTEFWSFPGNAPDNAENEPFLDFLYYLGNTTDTPFVFSTSYGEDEDSVSLDYATRINQEFAEQGARGISFLFASGDSGVGSAFGACTTYTPQYPSDSPYVTAVGGTTGIGPETGASLSSGGFSNRWPQPSWQTAAVNGFLMTSTKLPDSNLYNASGRAFPDISAQATNFAVVNNGVTYPAVAGTSCASPTAGGIIGLLNDARFASGKTPLGFLNPLLYEVGSAFTDITAGTNPGCGTVGFTAKEGWDPVTGFGTPNFDKLLKIVLALP